MLRAIRVISAESAFSACIGSGQSIIYLRLQAGGRRERQERLPKRQGSGRDRDPRSLQQRLRNRLLYSLLLSGLATCLLIKISDVCLNLIKVCNFAHVIPTWKRQGLAGHGSAKTALPISALANRGYGIARIGLQIQLPLVCAALLSRTYI